MDVAALGVAGPNEDRGNCNMVADLAGDYRDEVVCMGPTISVYSNVEPITHREYRLWLARNMGGGYASYFEWEP